MVKKIRMLFTAAVCITCSVFALTAHAEETAETDADERTHVITIDPGHQGSWIDMSGQEPVGPDSDETKAQSSTGTEGSYSEVPEYELNLQIAQLLRSELILRGYAVILTRESNDAEISNMERAQLANAMQSDAFIRIHANGSEDPDLNGALAMVPSPENPYVSFLSEQSYTLAECILGSYCESTGFASLGVLYDDGMTGMNWSEVPVMILEMGYMTNETDDLLMEEPEMQELMVCGIANGLDYYFEQTNG